MPHPANKDGPIKIMALEFQISSLASLYTVQALNEGAMTLIINNAEVERVLTMEMTLDALEESYLALAAGEAVCRPRIDIRIPTSDPAKNYQWGTMEGGSTAGYFAIRMKSDVIYETAYNGAVTQEKYCMRPGLYCRLILLTSIQHGEFLPFINDRHLH